MLRLISLLYVAHEGTVTIFYPAGGDSLRLQPNMASNNTPQGAGGEFGPTLRENQRKYGNLCFGGYRLVSTR